MMNSPSLLETSLASALDEVPASPELSLSVVSSLREAQQAIVDTLAAQERAVASLYRTYARLLPSWQKFWTALTYEEEFHASLLSLLNPIIDRGHLFRGVNLHRAGCAPCTHWIRCQEQLAESEGVTVVEALTIAHAIESHLAVWHFFEASPTPDPTFNAFTQIMRIESALHADRIAAASHYAERHPTGTAAPLAA